MILVAARSPCPTMVACQARFSGNGVPWTACHQVPTQEWATATTGTGQGVAA